ncbi:MAG: 4-hydroxy-tetrahydrodipicolinate reductase [Kiritimatiellia bacterium]
MLKLAIIGAAGRMGCSLIRDLASFPEYCLVAAVDRSDLPALGEDSGTHAGTRPSGVPLTADVKAAIQDSDAVIDFSFHTSIPATAKLVREFRRPFLVGTTALDAEERAAVTSVAEVAPVLLASNMSLGINVLSELVKRAAELLPRGYDIEIVEMHHRHKKDAPSGTAMTLAEAAAAGRKSNLDDVACYGRHGITGERDAETIAIHALRGGDVVGDHTVIFAADGERIELCHKASSRQCFSSGALRAMLRLAALPPGLYNMSQILNGTR